MLDSEENAKSEIGFFFPEFNYKNWFDNDEIYFRNKKNLTFDENLFVHKITNKN